MVTVLHPNTKDQAVLRYLAANGKISQSDQVVHHVYPGKTGTSLLAGKLNSNRRYLVEVSKPMCSFHIIDGEKVYVRYRGQTKSCARCHQTKTKCPGKAIARECTADRILLSTHMQLHWNKIGYIPDTNSTEDVDEDENLEINIQVGPTADISNNGPDLTDRYNAVIISGFLPTTELSEIHPILVDQGLPEEILVTNIAKNEKSGKLTIPSLTSVHCLSLIENMHGKTFLDRKSS